MGLRLRALCAAGFALAIPAVLPAQRFESRELAGLRWFKGNTHTHTTESISVVGRRADNYFVVTSEDALSFAVHGTHTWLSIPIVAGGHSLAQATRGAG